VIPGRRDAVLDIVTVDHVADAILALAASPAAADGTFHVVAGEQATTLGELAYLAGRRFDRRAPRLVPPRIYRSVLHPPILRRADPNTRRRLVRNEVYLPYFSLDLRFDDRPASELLDSLGIRDASQGVLRHSDRLRGGRSLGTSTDRTRPCASRANPSGDFSHRGTRHVGAADLLSDGRVHASKAAPLGLDRWPWRSAASAGRVRSEKEGRALPETHAAAR
jgi:hypothetical protein